MKTEIAYIYGLVDPRNNLIRYIGKTVSPKKRISEHITESKIYNHHRAKWIRSLQSENLSPIFKVLKVCPLSEFEKYEAEYIQLYKSNGLTNSDETGQGNTGRKREIIDKASKKISKKVYQFNLQGEFIKEYKSTREASRILSISHANISRSCNKIIKHASGFIFSYRKNVKIEPLLKPNAVKKSIIEIDNFGNEINRWESLMDCSRETKIDNGNLSRVCNGKLQSIKGRIFRFIN